MNQGIHNIFVVVEEVFIVYGDGRSVKHISSKNEALDDEDTLSSMLTIVQKFIEGFIPQQTALRCELDGAEIS